MTTKKTTKKTALAMRRQMLIVRCALQRVDAGNAARALIAPFGAGGGFKMPMSSIGGVLLGLVGTRASRLMPMVTAALSLWKLMGSLRAFLRRPPAA